MAKRSSTFVLSAMCFGYAFLYIPIFLLIAYSFNDSKLATVWGGFSTRWYVELFQNEQIMAAAWLSLKIAFLTATFAVILGTMAGIAIIRYGRFKGRMLFTGMITAPMVMPEVITGLSLLLLFVSMESLLGWPAERGTTTIIIAHVTFAMAYVTVVVQSRLASIDQSIEEAAMDLGCRPLRILYDITLPMILPAIISGWLLAFTLSLDDLVIATFVTGPGASTLPMVIFSKIKLGISPDINALATIVIFLVFTGVLASSWINRKTSN
ncbi:ABC transporter permease subunit [Amphritea sp. 1_MG-2023]|uniref:ABC transporter permease subunit n=1 Tax=Amphritea sp. 1_MG-2023 TaxID=3062670 RepID=UPI0026E32B27|nr:ABC transporter permease subunit [Amphritea sp. 1_MG-2023]MDO6563396.1 ABC transporter permease subunit [Amphritea sp. 1_MG-2023]